MPQNIFRCVAIPAHHRCSNLAHAYTMPPTSTVQDKTRRDSAISIKRALNNKGRTIQMTLREPLSYFKLLTHYHCAFYTHNFKNEAQDNMLLLMKNMKSQTS
jgi:hypothetical protein